MEMTFRRFRSIITSVPLLNENPTLNCFNLTNKNKGMTCFILDENAFVLDTNLEIAEIGKSLAIVDNQLLESLIAHDVYTSVLTYLGSFLYGKADGAYIDIRPDNRSCMYIRQFILAGTHATSRIAGNITCNSDNSTRAFFISPINNTNLKLVIVEESKSELCNNNSVSVPTAEQIKNRTCTEDGNYRKGPEFCFKKITPSLLIVLKNGGYIMYVRRSNLQPNVKYKFV
ncbi:uncharacterized protein TRIADDRAFT_56911 [Trichoplax adhaerens]|uniref:Voltage-dependent calcium channel alpha-2/delta subunit conserved region domain-containing protein n=1 Tax=Trichoplax adhaerens TaxID=10228 RepID=B3RWW8_TRIAD|nr:predicted protein [Trichoplax adhaerens]EDV24768.1 predicted protein [Trichoplax adhaerens]|eukprot:XP_002112658.1 predicted protein [Trichoplax adhaerens]